MRLYSAGEEDERFKAPQELVTTGAKRKVFLSAASIQRSASINHFANVTNHLWGSRKFLGQTVKDFHSVGAVPLYK